MRVAGYAVGKLLLWCNKRNGSRRNDTRYALSRGIPEKQVRPAHYRDVTCYCKKAKEEEDEEKVPQSDGVLN